MPAVSFYLRQEVLDAVRSKAKREGVPVSRIISRALEEALSLDGRSLAKKRLLEALVKARLEP